MALCLRFRASFQGVNCPTISETRPKLPSRIHCHCWSKHNSTSVASTQIRDERPRCLLLKKFAFSVTRNHPLATTDGEDFDPEPFWSYLFKETLRSLKSLLTFLAEQPSQLKYIEWPSFQSTLKTATLTLLLVGMLIVALSSIDAALCYILALLSGRRA